MDELIRFATEVGQNLFDSQALLHILARPELMLAAFVLLNAIVFTETGLLVGFFLPGDSLLVTAGMAAYLGGWSLPWLLITLCISAIIGDSVGYSIGYKTGPKIFCRENSWFFHKDHLLKAQSFYQRHGGKTIVLARFMPLIRTFAPVVAGVGRMDYRRFLFFNIFGGIGWVFSMILLGYALIPALNPALSRLLGRPIQIEQHVEKVIILVVLLSISPGIWAWLRTRLAKKAVLQPVPVKVD
jgi:membrane-associated protein